MARRPKPEEMFMIFRGALQSCRGLQKSRAQLHGRFQAHAQRARQVCRIRLGQGCNGWNHAGVVDQVHRLPGRSRTRLQPGLELLGHGRTVGQVGLPFNELARGGWGRFGQAGGSLARDAQHGVARFKQLLGHGQAQAA
jgi:hypothetical protein